MPAPKKGKRFGGSAAHQKLMLANLASHLIISEAGAITTTEAKAKALRPYVEKLVTKAKHGGVHKQRIVVSRIHDKDAAHRLFDYNKHGLAEKRSNTSCFAQVPTSHTPRTPSRQAGQAEDSRQL